VIAVRDWPASTPALLVAEWQAIRSEQHEAFAVRAHAWLMGRDDPVLTWPSDEREMLEQVGIPCVDCLEVVRAAGPGHVVRYLMRDGEHWASGIWATCGAALPLAPELRAAVTS
jgi:hypothetical protein